MRKTILSVVVGLSMPGWALDNTLCFTQSMPSKDGTLFLDSEIYVERGRMPEDYSIKIVTQGQVVKGATVCQVEPAVIGYGTHLLCGEDKVSLDLSNNSGHITRYSPEFKSFGEQKLVCRHKDLLLP